MQGYQTQLILHYAMLLPCTFILFVIYIAQLANPPQESQQRWRRAAPPPKVNYKEFGKSVGETIVQPIFGLLWTAIVLGWLIVLPCLDLSHKWRTVKAEFNFLIAASVAQGVLMIPETVTVAKGNQAGPFANARFVFGLMFLLALIICATWLKVHVANHHNKEMGKNLRILEQQATVLPTQQTQTQSAPVSQP